MFVGILLQSCSEEIDYFSDDTNDCRNIETINTEPIDWKSQLEKIINIPPDVLKNSNIELLCYEVVDDINNPIKENTYKNVLKKDENMFPFFSSDLKTIKAISKKEAIRLKSQHQKFTFEERDKFVDNLNLKEAKTLNLKWNNNGVETNTICIVSEKEGIIYDNFITNTIVIKDPVIDVQICTNKVGKMTPRLKSSSEFIISTTQTWTLKAEATWIWGSDRGHAIITHEGCYSGKKFSYQNYSASHYFALGNSDAQVEKTGKNTIAYGYGFATPLVTINLTFNHPSFNLSFSTIWGSTAGETGSHSHPLLLN